MKAIHESILKICQEMHEIHDWYIDDDPSSRNKGQNEKPLLYSGDVRLLGNVIKKHLKPF
jgi:hypothetical protein